MNVIHKYNEQLLLRDKQIREPRPIKSFIVHTSPKIKFPNGPFISLGLSTTPPQRSSPSSSGHSQPRILVHQPIETKAQSRARLSASLAFTITDHREAYLLRMPSHPHCSRCGLIWCHWSCARQRRCEGRAVHPDSGSEQPLERIDLALSFRRRAYIVRRGETNEEELVNIRVRA